MMWVIYIFYKKKDEKFHRFRVCDSGKRYIKPALYVVSPKMMTQTTCKHSFDFFLTFNLLSEPVFEREAPLRFQDLSVVSPSPKKSIPRIFVRPTTRKFHDNNSNGSPKKNFDPSKKDFDPLKKDFDPSKKDFDPSEKDFDPLTKSPSQEGNAFMSKSLLTMDVSRCPKDKSEFHEKNIETQSPFLVPVSITKTPSNDSLKSVS